MSQEVTDAMLDRQSKILAEDYVLDREDGGQASTWARSDGFRDSTRVALEVERACYYVLKEALSIAMRDASEHEDPSLYVMQLRAIIDRLRTRLGINPE